MFLIADYISELKVLRSHFVLKTSLLQLLYFVGIHSHGTGAAGRRLTLPWLLLAVPLLDLLDLLLVLILFLQELSVCFLLDLDLLLLHLKYLVFDFFKLEVALLLVPDQLPPVLVIQSLELLDLAEKGFVLFLVRLFDF